MSNGRLFLTSMLARAGHALQLEAWLTTCTTPRPDLTMQPMTCTDAGCEADGDGDADAEIRRLHLEGFPCDFTTVDEEPPAPLEVQGFPEEQSDVGAIPMNEEFVGEPVEEETDQRPDARPPTRCADDADEQSIRTPSERIESETDGSDERESRSRLDEKSATTRNAPAADAADEYCFVRTTMSMPRMPHPEEHAVHVVTSWMTTSRATGRCPALTTRPRRGRRGPRGATDVAMARRPRGIPGPQAFACATRPVCARSRRSP